VSLSGLFDIGRSALFASQTGLYVTGHNIANVNTPGFNRQEVILETTTPELLLSPSIVTGAGFTGRGVRVAGIRRYFDRFIYNQIFFQSQKIGLTRTMSNIMTGIEETFNDLKGAGLSGALQEFYSAWQEVSSSPDLLPARNLLLTKADSFLRVAKEMEGAIKNTLNDIERQIKDSTEKINSLLKQIGDLNGKILQVESGLLSEKANDLRDQREEALKRLSELIDISYYEEDNGSVTVNHGTFALVERENVSMLSAPVERDGRRGVFINGQDITDTIRQGELGGLLSSRRDIENYQLFGLRRLVGSVIKEINLQHRQGYGLDGTTGVDFFTPVKLYLDNYSQGAVAEATIRDMGQLTLDEYEITFASGNYTVRSIQTGNLVASGTYISGNPISFEGIEVTVTGSVLQDERIVISPLKNLIKDAEVAISDPLKIAASSSGSTIPLDNLNALRIVNLFESSLPELGDSTFFEYYNALVSTTGIMSRNAQDSLKFEENLMAELTRQRDALSGVNLDEEAVNLIKYQRAFEAGARIIKVADELLETILNI
jgi:flagellar hook-associated protein 1 FlgK